MNSSNRRQIMTCLAGTLRRAAWAPLAVVAVYAVAAKGFDVYLRWPDLDMPTHFLGGLAITYFFSTAADIAQTLVGPVPRIARQVMALGCTAITAVCWEFLEFLSDTWFGTKMNLGVSDTLSDLFFGLTGGLVAVVVLARRRHDGTPGPARDLPSN